MTSNARGRRVHEDRDATIRARTIQQRFLLAIPGKFIAKRTVNNISRELRLNLTNSRRMF